MNDEDLPVTPEQTQGFPPPPAGFDVLPASAAAKARRPWVPVLSAVAVLAAIAAALVLVVGGGGSSSVGDAAAVVHAASTRAAKAGSSSIDLQMTIKSGGHKETATGSGAFDYRRRLGQMALDMSGMGQMQEVVTPTAFYMRVPAGMAGVLGDATKPWVEIRYSAMKAAGVDFNKLMNANPGTDPSSMLQLLSKSTGIRQVGNGTVRGVKTTHYAGTSTMLDMIRAEGMSGAVDLSKLPAGVENSQIHLDVWVDKTGLARRVSMAMDMALYGSMTMSMDLYDFGKPVSVTVPPASIVTDISQQLATMPNSSGSG
jgi:hypothetical protein